MVSNTADHADLAGFGEKSEHMLKIKGLRLKRFSIPL
jgi:hypothetical protein